MNKNKKKWRSQFPVLVCQSEERISIAVIRSLGRAGYPVHACSYKENALGLYSNFVFRTAICPSYGSNKFSSWLKEYCNNHKIKCIIPTEELLLGIRSDFENFKHLFPLSQDEVTVYKGMSKFDLFQTMQGIYAKADDQEAHLPPTILIEKESPDFDADSFRHLKAPFFIKADGCYSPVGTKSVTQKVETVDQAIILVNKYLKQFDKLLIQGFIPGVGAGVFLLRWQGRILARFMHIRLHETLYGWSSYRKSWWQQEIYDDAEKKLSAMNWEGVAMMEYRWDEASNDFALIEMNGRFWGSLHLALYAEVDFPAILLDAFHGSVDDAVYPVKQEVYCRNAVLELRYLVTQFNDPDNSMRSKLYFLMEYIFLTLNPGIKSDLFFPGDRSLFWLEIWGKILLIFERLKGSISK